MGAKSGSMTTRPQIRWMAIVMTPWAWVLGTVMSVQFYGQTLNRGAIVAAVGALGALLAWASYHAISRRNDGLAIFIVVLSATCFHPLPTLPLSQVVTMQTFVIVVLAVGFSAFGVIFRAPREGDGKTTGSALWDAELDSPRTS